MPASAGTPILKTKTKRTFAFLLLLVALLVPWAAVGQSQTLTVCDGTNNNEHVPFEAFSAVNAQHNQMIFPATELAAMNGQNIRQMVFYIDLNEIHNGQNIYADLGTWTVSLGETSATTLNSLDKTTALTQVYQNKFNNSTNALDPSAGTLTIPIDEYIYHGGNLLVDLNHATITHGISLVKANRVSQPSSQAPRVPQLTNSSPRPPLAIKLPPPTPSPQA